MCFKCFTQKGQVVRIFAEIIHVQNVGAMHKVNQIEHVENSSHGRDRCVPTLSWQIFNNVCRKKLLVITEKRKVQTSSPPKCNIMFYILFILTQKSWNTKIHQRSLSKIQVIEFSFVACIQKVNVKWSVSVYIFLFNIDVIVIFAL